MALNFEISKEEYVKFVEWDNKHECPNKNSYAGAIGGRLSFKFTHTTIGTIKKVICNRCEHQEDITDFSWF